MKRQHSDYGKCQKYTMQVYLSLKKKMTVNPQYYRFKKLSLKRRYISRGPNEIAPEIQQGNKLSKRNTRGPPGKPILPASILNAAISLPRINYILNTSRKHPTASMKNRMKHTHAHTQKTEREGNRALWAQD